MFMNGSHKAWIDNKLLYAIQYIFVEFIKVELCGRVNWNLLYYLRCVMNILNSHELLKRNIIYREA